jgi:putative drug exporter of the RND superfamily
MQRLARWSIEHRRRVVAAWCVLLVSSIGLAGALRNHFDNNLTLPGTGAQYAADLLHRRFPARAGDTDQIVFRTASAGLRDAATRARVTQALAAVARLPHVSGVASPYTSPHAIGRDGTIGFATVTFDERADALPTKAVTNVIGAAERARSSTLQVALGGGAIEESQRPTLGAATAIGILAAMVVLFLSFGSLLAMALPIATALFGLGTSMGLIAALTHAVPTPDFASELALLIGLGVGIDYALFVVTRYRDRYRENGGDTTDAVEVAMNTAGRSITFAGATVVIAVLGLFVTGVHIFYGVALALALTVMLVLAASLTLLPAVLSLAGQRIGARGRRPEAGGFSAAWFGAILRRPAPAAIAATTLLLLLAAPAFGLRLAASDAGNDAASTTTHQAYELLSKGFGPGFNAPLQLAVQLPANRRAQTLAHLEGAVANTRGVASVDSPLLNAAGDTAALTVYLDAIVIRSILLPAVLRLLGRATWRFPAWADRLLPRLAIEVPDQPSPEPPPAPALEVT